LDRFGINIDNILQQYFFVVAVMFKRDKLRWHPRPNIAVDIVAIATYELARNREEVVFYLLTRILENEERESRRKKVKDMPQDGSVCNLLKHTVLISDSLSVVKSRLKTFLITRAFAENW